MFVETFSEAVQLQAVQINHTLEALLDQEQMKVTLKRWLNLKHVMKKDRDKTFYYSDSESRSMTVNVSAHIVKQS